MKRRAHRVALVLGLALLLGAACGDRPISPSQSPDGTLPGDGGPVTPTSPECVVAVRVDACCSTAQPTPAAQLRADPCLVPWPLRTLLSAIPAVCKTRWKVSCDLVDCTWMPGKTRLVEAVGGTCVWKSECASDAGCVAARDARQCCSCPAGYPAELLAQDPCLSSVQQPGVMFPSPACKEVAQCQSVSCKSCAPTPTPRCAVTNDAALRRCTP